MVEKSITKKVLEHHKYAQCKIAISKDGFIVFRSYETNVIYARPVGNNIYELQCTGTYSATTRKQIGWFLKEYFGNLNYYDIKEIAGTEKTIFSEKIHAKYW